MSDWSGFSPQEALEWWGAQVNDPKKAAEMRSWGITPKQAGQDHPDLKIDEETPYTWGEAYCEGMVSSLELADFFLPDTPR